jgi:CubicO group peptidase (beta-lactamase class C family)
MMKRYARALRCFLLLLFSLVAPLLCLLWPERAAAQTTAIYYPAPGDKWERRKPEQVGLNPVLLAEAIEFAKQQKEPKTVAQVIAVRQGQESHPEIIGPLKEHGEINGLVLRHGYIVTEFGDTSRADMTFSATKSFLSAIAGLSYDRGMIKDLNEPVQKLIHDGGFDSPHNAQITWQHLLQQTSEWEGWLWEKPATIDEPKGHQQQAPGTFWNYNDVRVNRLSLALLRLWKKPLPQVLKDEIMDYIGASSTWQWNGYRNSEVEIDGKKLLSVSGGGHWGGGLFVNSRDMARFGYLYLRRGKWNGKQLISEKWIEFSTTPCAIRDDYGFLWWLDKYPGSAQIAFDAAGAGGNVVWVDPDNDLVVVLRWATNHDKIFKRVRAAVVQASRK